MLYSIELKVIRYTVLYVAHEQIANNSTTMLASNLTAIIITDRFNNGIIIHCTDMHAVDICKTHMHTLNPRGK